jgi:hypothetical protein
MSVGLLDLILWIQRETVRTAQHAGKSGVSAARLFQWPRQPSNVPVDGSGGGSVGGSCNNRVDCGWASFVRDVIQWNSTDTCEGDTIRDRCGECAGRIAQRRTRARLLYLVRFDERLVCTPLR